MLMFQRLNIISQTQQTAASASNTEATSLLKYVAKAWCFKHKRRQITINPTKVSFFFAWKYKIWNSIHILINTI